LCKVLLVVAAFGITGCFAPSSNETAFAAPTQLTATLAGPNDIDLKWKDNASGAAGNFVEYQPEADEKFIIITALPSNVTAYRHPHLLPRTRFVYRIVPFFGPASNTAEIKMEKEGTQQFSSSSQTPEAVPREIKNKKSIRDIKTISAAAPTDLQATFMPPNGVTLKWNDHAGDADGYLVEIKPEWSHDFKVSAFLAPGTTSVTSYGFPAGTKFTFRVRAFFYGQPSNVAAQTTGG
jgi:hypothetical protein